MPVYPIPNNPLIIKTALIFQRDTRTLVNVLHWFRAAGWDLSQMLSQCIALKNWVDTYLKPCIPPQTSLVQVQARKYDPAAPLAQDYSVSPVILGTRGTVSEAANVTSTLSWRTGLAGKAYRGRIYVPGLSEADVQQNDQLSSALVALLTTAAVQLVTGVGVPNSSVPVVFHRPLPAPKPLDNTYTPINSYVIENIVDSQRKRLPLRGR